MQFLQQNRLHEVDSWIGRSRESCVCLRTLTFFAPLIKIKYIIYLSIYTILTASSMRMSGSMSRISCVLLVLVFCEGMKYLSRAILLQDQARVSSWYSSNGRIKVETRYDYSQ